MVINLYNKSRQDVELQFKCKDVSVEKFISTAEQNK